MVHRYVLSAIKLYNAMVNGGPMYMALLKHSISNGLERLPGVRIIRIQPVWLCVLGGSGAVACLPRSWRSSLLVKSAGRWNVGVPTDYDWLWCCEQSSMMLKASLTGERSYPVQP